MLFGVVLAIAIGVAGYAINNGASSSGLASACAASHCTAAIPTTSAVPNPCTLLTDAAAAAALGTTGIQFRDSQRAPGMSSSTRMCTWKGTPLNNAAYSNSTVMVMTYRSTRAQFLKAEAHSIVIHGLGEAAYAWPGQLNMISVFQHGYVLQIHAGPAVNPLQAETKLAKLALTRLH